MTTCCPGSRAWIARRVDAVAARHADVHQHDVGLVLRAEGHRVVAGRGAADDDEASVAVEDRPDQFGELIVVLGEQDSEGVSVTKGGACHTRP